VEVRLTQEISTGQGPRLETLCQSHGISEAALAAFRDDDLETFLAQRHIYLRGLERDRAEAVGLSYREDGSES